MFYLNIKNDELELFKFNLERHYKWLSTFKATLFKQKKIMHWLKMKNKLFNKLKISSWYSFLWKLYNLITF
jgi:hypothetical protein